jgi:predicted DNA binding CopG/RHH family protein
MKAVKIRLSIWEKNLIEELSRTRSFDASEYARFILIGFKPSSIAMTSPISRIRFLCSVQGLSGMARDVGKYPITKNKVVYPSELIKQLRFELDELKKRVVKDEIVAEDIHVQRVDGDEELTAISVRLLDSEIAKIKREAKIQRISSAQYIRNCLRERRLPNQLAGVSEKINQDLKLLRSELIQGTCNIQAWIPILRSSQ